MPRPKDSGRIRLTDIFARVQHQMLAQLAVGNLFEHATSCGAATEQRWIDMLNQYLPQRYHASSAFVVDSRGRRSRQIDLAVYDRLYSPLIFHHDAGFHIPAESVYAVFEVKQFISPQWIRDAGQKVASVRSLHRTSAPVISAGRPRPPLQLAPILAVDSTWNRPDAFHRQLKETLAAQSPLERLDLGCALRHGAFELRHSRLYVSSPDFALIWFLLRLLHRLQHIGTAPALDLDAYARSLDHPRRP